MTKQQTERNVIRKSSHSKSSKEGIGILANEIELALKWNRPSILIAIHNSSSGLVEAQKILERKLKDEGQQVTYINLQSENPDVIRAIGKIPDLKDTIFFLSGIENADQASGGKVYRALNIGREFLVERQIRVIFWFNEIEAANLPRFAPDFWAFRHRVVEFAPKRGTKKHRIPAGLFLWEEQIQQMDEEALVEKIKYYKDFLKGLPQNQTSTSLRAETIIKLAHYSWLLSDMSNFWDYIKDGNKLLEKYQIPHYQAWLLNAKGIGLYEEGKRDDANLLISQALVHDPENIMIMMNSSISAHGLGKNREAILISKRAIKKDANNPYLWCTIGFLFLSMGKLEDAINAMNKSREIYPGNTDIYYSLAICYYKNGQHEKCAEFLSMVKTMSTHQSSIQRVYADFINGKTNETLTQLRDAMESGEIKKHNILRDPNLHFLVNVQEFIDAQ